MHPHHFCRILNGINYHWPYAQNDAGIIAGLGLPDTHFGENLFQINEPRLFDYQGKKHLVETV